MANRHYAAMGDVWKHLTLGEALQAVRPRRYWETHAGSATYPLTDSPTRRHGAIRFLARASSEPILLDSAYYRVLRSVPGLYPGSPTLAMSVLSGTSKYVFCDVDPVSVEDLRLASAGYQATIIKGDGLATIHALADDVSNPSEVLVHIDPYDPHERPSAGGVSAIELAGLLARRGFQLFYWYGYEAASDRGWALDKIRDDAPGANIWCGDFVIPSRFVFPERPGLWGCGVVLVNLNGSAAEACTAVGRALERIASEDVLIGNIPDRASFAVFE